MKKYLTGLFIAMLLNACSSENKDGHSAHQGHEDTSHADHQHPQAKELMAIHDSIMPQMGWMHQYKADTLEKLGDSQREKYIEDQKARIQVVRQQMKASINTSKTFIQKSVE